MKEAFVSGKRSGRGAFALAFLGLSAVLAGGSAVALMFPGQVPGPAAARLNPLVQAKVAYADRNHARAEELLRGILSADADNLEARTLLGRVLLAAGGRRLSEAQQLFADIVRADPSNVEATRGLAGALEGLGQIELSVFYWRKAAQLRPTSADLWRECGLAQKRAGDLRGAAASLQQSLAVDGDQPGLAGLIHEMSTGQEAWAGPAGMGLPAGFDPRHPSRDPFSSLTNPSSRLR